MIKSFLLLILSLAGLLASTTGFLILKEILGFTVEKKWPYVVGMVICGIVFFFSLDLFFHSL